MPHDLFWRLTREELDALLSAWRKRRQAEARERAHNTASIMAAIYNAMTGSKLTADDFVKLPPKKLTPKQMESVLDAWARGENARHKA